MNEILRWIYKYNIVLSYRFLISIFGFRWQDKITELCYLTGFPILPADFEYMKKNEIKHIFFLGHEIFYSKKWLEFLKNNSIELHFFDIKDRHELPNETLEEIYKIYELASFNKQKMLFHCTYGQWRSFTALAYCLIKNKIKNYSEITAFVRKSRRQASFTKRQREYMDKLFAN